ncbi:2-dehydro-3-deoxyphosphogluconate aldolase / (4S)-4-hydroxy-2-oxoglutarate aldolase [Marmoricola sp. URHA0025 HA25]
MLVGPGKVIQQLTAARIVPVYTAHALDEAEPVAHALVRAGLSVVEVTLRTSVGIQAIATMSDVDGIITGAGTVTTARQVDAVADAGAQFVVSPGLDAEVVARALKRGLLPIPGVATATEAQAAARLGLTLLKIFPADLTGGPAFVSALSAPFPHLRFMPSGGIDETTASQYLALPTVSAVSGSWMFPADSIAKGRFEDIERLALSARTTAMKAAGP